MSKNQNPTDKQKAATYYSLFNFVSDAIYIQDKSGKFLDVNEGVLRMYGYDKNEIVGYYPEKLSAPNRNNLQELEERIVKAFNGEEQIFEFWGIRKNGEVFPKEVVLNKGTFFGEEVVIAVARDISQRKKTEQILFENEEKYRISVELSNDAILIASDKGIILDCNTAGRRVFGFSKSEIIGMSLQNLFERDFLSPPFPEKWDKNISSKIICRKKNGLLFPSQVTAKTFSLRGENKFLIYIADITQQKKYEERLNKLATELRLLNEEKDKFFSVISHDLRNPFHALLGLSDFITSEFDNVSRDELKEIVININASTKMLHSFVINLLEWANVQTGITKYQPAEHKLLVIINDIIDVLQILCMNKKIELKVDVDKQISVYADSNMVKSILNNLISNAIKFTETGGTIIISAKSEQNITNIFVKDSGVGMTDEFIEKLFSLKNISSTEGTAEEKGSGLGLLICKELIAKQGGEIKVESSLGEGTTFSFTLPSQNQNKIL